MMKEALQPRSRCTHSSGPQSVADGDDDKNIKGAKRTLPEVFRSSSSSSLVFPAVLIVVAISVACWNGIHRAMATNFSKNNKPHLIIHLGPTKTATTTIQVELTKFQNALEKDNYVYLGKYQPGSSGLGVKSRILEIMQNQKCQQKVHQARFAGEERPECWKEMVNLIQEYRTNGTSIIMSAEGFSFTLTDIQDMGRQPIDWAALHEDLGADWNIVAIVAYRRFMDWIPSARQQRDRWGPMRKTPTLIQWPPKGKHLQPLFPAVLDWPPISGIQPNHTMAWYHYDTEAVLDMIKPHVQCRIFNMYMSQSIRTNFVCNMLPNAYKSCQVSILKDQEEGSDTSYNSEQSLYYDAVATAAAEKGLLKDYELYARHNVATAIQVHQEQQLNLTSHDFATRCPPNRQLELLLQASLNKEAKIMPGLFSEEQHRDLFWQNVANGKYCWVDVKTVLKLDEWKEFFATLTPKQADEMAESITVTNFFGFPIVQTGKTPQGDNGKKRRKKRHRH